MPTAAVPMQSVSISLPKGRSYQVLVGHDILTEIGTRCRELDLGMRVAAVVDPVLTERTCPKIVNSLRAADFDVEEILFQAGISSRILIPPKKLLVNYWIFVWIAVAGSWPLVVG